MILLVPYLGCIILSQELAELGEAIDDGPGHPPGIGIGRSVQLK